MVGRDRRELKNRLRIILLHLLKWQAQPGKRGASWRKSLRTQRRHIKDLLKRAPASAGWYRSSCVKPIQTPSRTRSTRRACRPTNFPADCPYAPDDGAGRGILPDASF